MAGIGALSAIPSVSWAVPTVQLGTSIAVAVFLASYGIYLAMSSSENGKENEDDNSEDSEDPNDDIDDVPEQPVGKVSRVDSKWLKNKNVDPHTAKDGAPGSISEFDIYVDKAKNLWRVRKGQNPNQGEYLGNLQDYQ
jgi:hypothetical protein